MLAAPQGAGAPVKWIEDRRENLLAAGQARHEHGDGHDGVRRRRRASWPRTSTTSQDCGAYPTPWPVGTGGRRRHAVPRPVPRARARLRDDDLGLHEHRRAAPRTAGPWQFESLAREVLLDIAARRMGIDPVELRRRNLLAPRRPARTRNANGMPYDHISPLETFEQALEMLDYDAFRARAGRGPARPAATSASASATTSSRRRRAFGVLRHRGRDDPHRAVRQGQRVRRRRLDRQQPRDDGRAAHRRRARRRHRGRQHDPGRHRGHRRSAPAPAGAAAAR